MCPVLTQGCRRSDWAPFHSAPAHGRDVKDHRQLSLTTVAQEQKAGIAHIPGEAAHQGQLRGVEALKGVCALPWA
jgi:hypothetical protein